jgi:hypothetical protein
MIAHIERSGTQLSDFPEDADIRYLCRALVEASPPKALLVLDYSDLVEGGYYQSDDDLCAWARQSVWHDARVNDRIIILTEGSTDSELLQATLAVRYPHLKDYYCFPDFARANAAGGAPTLVATVKAFISASIQQRVIALFDNDSAAEDALRGLRDVCPPDNIHVLLLPALDLARSYPTLGPQGTVMVDVNSAAASLELYFGRDILTDGDNTLVPVQWRGWNQAVGRYQGEVLHKEDLQRRYRALLKQISLDPGAAATHDWSGMDAVFGAIFRVFTS